MTPDDPLAREVHAVRHSLGGWLREDHTFIRITGADAASWLHSQTTNDVIALKSGDGHHNAALDRQGRLQAHFTLHRWDAEFWMLVERAQSAHLLAHLDAHLFIEDAKMEETGDELDQIVIQGPKTLAVLANILGTDHVATNELFPNALHGVHPVELAGVEALAFRESPSGEDGYILVLEKGKGRALLDEILARARELGHDALEISPDAQEVLRIEAGIPRFDTDIDRGQVIPETTLERDCVSYTKGCYLGQEVVARLKTYGSPKRALMGLIRSPTKRGTGVPPVWQGRPGSASSGTERTRRPENDQWEDDPHAPVHKRHGAYLPHWTKENATYFVTFRLADSLPRQVMEKLKSEKGKIFKLVEDALHTGDGPQYLSDPRIADLVQNALLHFHMQRYFLCAWAILPNHVHVLVRPFASFDLKSILHSWKSFTAHEANKILNRTGNFWQAESYDYMIRDEQDYWRRAEYTLKNPAKAGLQNWRWMGSNDLVDFIDAGETPASHGRDTRATMIGDVLVAGKSIGRATSACTSPTLCAEIVLASLDRDHRTPGDVLPTTVSFGSTFSFPKEKVEVRALPFYEAPSREARARALYDRALQLFQADSEDVDPAAIPLLEEALLLHPRFEDAYEVLGVILHRQGRTDDAIHIMRQLAALNPDCLMAHTNLSVFYVAKGLIPEAEEEKAKAAVLQIQRAGAERAAKEAADSERKRLESEARERIGMFKEVLDIDPDDPLATFGLGKAYIQLNQFADALPHLERATQLQKDYSAAWLDYAKCHEFLGHTSEAAAAYKAGIAAAARKGDLMPMREMERRLKALA